MNNSLFRHSPWAAPCLSLLLSLGLAACDSGSSGSGTRSTTPTPPELSAWVGAKDSQITVSGDNDVLEGLKFYLGQDPDCDVEALGETCARQFNLDNPPLTIDTDESLTLSQLSYARLRQGDQEATTLLNTQRFSARSSHEAVYFKGRFWLVGGYGVTDDLWSSSDGINWRQETSVNSNNSNETHLFVGRGASQLVVFDAVDDSPDTGEQLWLLGGDQGGDKNDIWSSSDGIRWTLQKAATPAGDDHQFSPRHDHQVAVFDADGNGQPELWLLGGTNGGDEVWTSTNGVDWNQQTKLSNSVAGEPIFSARRDHQLVAFDGGDGERLWLIGGDGLNDIWSSPDGQTWTQHNSDTERFSTRRGSQVAVFNPESDAGKAQLWLVGGESVSDGHIWTSNNGIDWFRRDDPSFITRFYHQLVVADTDHNGRDELWVLAGQGEQAQLNDTLSTVDGRQWTHQSPYADFSPREASQIVRFDAGDGERLWLVGGRDNQLTNDIWSSVDGVHWRQENAHNRDEKLPLFAPRSNHQLVVFDAQGDQQGPLLWLIGGNGGSSGLLGDVWSSPDGREWTQQDLGCDTNDCFGGRYGHQVVVFDAGQGEQLWLIGGESDSANYNNDVWSSSNGKDWHKVPADNSPIFDPRNGHRVAVFDPDPNDQTPAAMWLIGGYVTSLVEGVPQFKNFDDVWSSNDGATWTQESLVCEPCFSGRKNHQLAVYAAPGDSQPRLWLVGGNSSGGYLNDIWSSSDGVQWDQSTDAAPFPPIVGSQLVVFGGEPDQPDNQALWLISGATDQGASNQVWRSTDGVDWRLSIKTPLQLPARAGQ